MKIIWYVIILCFFILSISCKNITYLNNEESTKSVVVKNTETYEFRTGISGDEEGATILLQAKHYLISDVIRNAETNWEAVYVYKPEPLFIGTDYVELKLSTGSDGASPATNIEIIKIKIFVE